MITAVLLAGGRSSRMGENKAFLKIGCRTFLDIQLEKLCALSVDEILISGDPDIIAPSFDKGSYNKSIRIVPDIVKDLGPLGGLYSCFCETKCDTALVVGTDVPLISAATLNNILSYHLSHKNDATVLSAASHIEPLIAAYSTVIHHLIKEQIDKGALSVRPLLDRINTFYLEYEGNPSELLNCNTPEDYQSIISLLS